MLVPFSRMVQEYTKTKCQLAGIDTAWGICASTVAADAIIKSNWNTHKISKKYNNLNLLEADQYWYGKSKEFEGTNYRIYECWFDYAADLSDYYVFSGIFCKVLECYTWDNHLNLLKNINCNSTTYYGRMDELIGDLGLWEFDLQPRR